MAAAGPLTPSPPSNDEPQVFTPHSKLTSKTPRRFEEPRPNPKTGKNDWYETNEIVKRTHLTELRGEAWNNEYAPLVTIAPMLSRAGRGLQRINLDGKTYGCETETFSAPYANRTDYIFRSFFSHPILRLSSWVPLKAPRSMSVLEVTDINYKGNLNKEEIIRAFQQQVSPNFKGGIESLMIKFAANGVRISADVAHNLALKVAQTTGAAFILYEDAAELTPSKNPKYYSGYLTINGKEHLMPVSTSTRPPDHRMLPVGYYERKPGAHLLVPNFTRTSPLFWVITQGGVSIPWLPLEHWTQVRRLYREYRALCMEHQRAACQVEVKEYADNFATATYELLCAGTDEMWTDIIDRIPASADTYRAIKAKEFEIHRFIGSLVPEGATLRGGCYLVSYDGAKRQITTENFQSHKHALKRLLCGTDKVAEAAAKHLNTGQNFLDAVNHLIELPEKESKKFMSFISPEKSDNALVIYPTGIPGGGGAAARASPRRRATAARAEYEAAMASPRARTLGSRPSYRLSKATANTEESPRRGGVKPVPFPPLSPDEAAQAMPRRVTRSMARKQAKSFASRFSDMC